MPVTYFDQSLKQTDMRVTSLSRSYSFFPFLYLCPPAATADVTALWRV